MQRVVDVAVDWAKLTTTPLAPSALALGTLVYGATRSPLLSALSMFGGSFAQLNNNVVLAGNTTLSSGRTAGNTLALGRRGFYNVPAGSTVDTNSTIAAGAHTLTLIGAAGTVTRFEGGLTGFGNVQINTEGAVHLYGPEHTFSGTTTVANGTLRVESGNTYLFGGFNGNGKEVGYLFQKSVPNGVLMGTTLWGR